MEDLQFDPAALSGPTEDVSDDGIETSNTFSPDVFKPDIAAPLEDAMYYNPDDHAKNLDLSRKSGLPAAAIAQDQKTVENQVKRREIKNTLDKHEFTATWMSEGDNARLAHDDVENLGAVENMVRGIGERIGDVAGGAMTALNTLARDSEKAIPLGGFKFKEDGFGIEYLSGKAWQERIDRGEKPGSEALEDFVKDLDFGHQEDRLASWESVKSEPLKNVLPFIFEQGLLSTPDMALAMINLPLSVVSMTGRISEERAGNEGRQEPTMEDLVKVLPAAAASAFLDRLGGRSILGIDDAVKSVGVKPLAKAIGAGVAKEGVTEFTQGSLENVGATLGTERGFRITEMLEQGFQEGLVGSGFGGSIRAVTASAEMANMAIKDSDIFNKMNKQEAALRERSPEKYAEFQGKLLRENGVEQVSISGEGWREYNQEMRDNSWIDTLGIAESGRLEMFEAMDGDVELTPEQYSLIPPKIAQQLQKHIRINDGMTEAEADAFQEGGMIEEFEKMSEALGSANPDTEQDIDLIQQKIEDQLQAAGESPETSSHYGVLMAQRYAARAERSGEGALELYMKDNLSITQGEEMNRVVDDLSINLDIARSNKTKEDYFNFDKQPIVKQIISSVGGIDPDGPLAAELRARDITKRMVPGLYKEGGVTDGDTFVRGEFSFFSDQVREEDQNGYIGTAELIDAIEREANGEANLTQSEMADLEGFDIRLENFNAEMESLGLDITKNTDQEIRAAVEGRVFDQSPDQKINITKDDPVFSIPRKELKDKEIEVQDEDGGVHKIKAAKAVTIVRHKLNQVTALVDCVNAG
tara:strand:- start:984 stop:3419 length:2436 start_codon:yes stop_codon:yes gene_type:complete